VFGDFYKNVRFMSKDEIIEIVADIWNLRSMRFIRTVLVDGSLGFISCGFIYGGG